MALRYKHLYQCLPAELSWTDGPCEVSLTKRAMPTPASFDFSGFMYCKRLLYAI